MNSTYFKWEWVKDGKVKSKSTERFESRADCMTSAMESAYSERPGAEVVITRYDANKPESRVRGSSELGHGIRIQAVEFNGEPRIDIRTWEKSAQGKGMYHSLYLHIHSMVKCRCNPSNTLPLSVLQSGPPKREFHSPFNAG